MVVTFFDVVFSALGTLSFKGFLGADLVTDGAFHIRTLADSGSRFLSAGVGAQEIITSVIITDADSIDFKLVGLALDHGLRNGFGLNRGRLRN